MTTAVNATLAGNRPFFTLTPLGALVGNLGAGAKNLFAGVANPDAVIEALFANNEQGVFFDPSDLSAMFQDSAGATQVTADGQPVGKILDKSGRGNHAIQATAAARPLYKERINLLSYSEDIAAEFDPLKVTITPNAVMAPNGTMTADQLTEGTDSNSYFGVYKPSLVPMDVAFYTVSIWAKPNGRNYLILYTYGNEEGYYGKYFELIGNGAVLGDYSSTPTNATITPFPNGWYLCTMTVPKSPANSGIYFDMYLSPDGLTDTYNGDGVSGVYLWGAQIEKSAEYTVYQRVEDDVYNTVGLPKWLQFDGVDDVLNTTFPASLGSSCTVAKAVVGGSPTILTGQTIGTTWAESTDNAGLIIIDRALTGQETTDLTAWLTAKGATA